MLKDLQLCWIKHESKENPNRQYLDYVVSGQPLREYLNIKNKSSVTPFGFFPSKEYQQIALKEFRLQQKPRLTGNRIELYVCECCGDIGCGAITARIIDNGDKIVWTNFACQSDPYEIGEEITADLIEFDRQKYFKALANLNNI